MQQSRVFRACLVPKKIDYEELCNIEFFRCGGRCISAEYTDKVGELAKSYGLQLHIDGARIFNASIVSSLLVYFLFFIF
jgi:threonine aldolase